MFLIVIKIYHFFLLNAQYQSLQTWHFGSTSPYCSEWWGSYKKINVTFIFFWFYHCHGRRICVWFWRQIQGANCFQTLNRNSIEYSRFTNWYRKTNKKSTVKHDWTSTVWQWTNRKHFLFARGNIWNFKVAFYNKSTCLLRHECFKRDLSVVTPF